MLKLKITDASWHRNGVSGVGFYAVLFDDLTEKKKMIASLFDEAGFCAVYDVAQLAEGNIKFANGNSWRGDHYESELRKLVEQFLKEQGTNLVGEFSFMKIPNSLPFRVVASNRASWEFGVWKEQKT